MLDMSYQGKEFPAYTFEVERSKIKELCLAIGDDNPIFFDKEAAKKEGFKDSPVSLTFPTVMNFWGYPEIWDRMKEIGVDVQKLLHASEEYEYFSSIYPGDVIEGSVMIDSLRSGGVMDVATFQSTYKRGGEVVLVAKMKIVVMTGE